MEMPIEEIIGRHFAMGIFALYVVLVSLVRIMAEQEFFRLTILKKLWGRTRGLIIHFVSNIAFPLVCGIVFFTQGVAGFSDPASLQEGDFFFLSSASQHLASTFKAEPYVSPELATNADLRSVLWCSEILPP